MNARFLCPLNHCTLCLMLSSALPYLETVIASLPALLLDMAASVQSLMPHLT
jgi:hypothetical protein